VPGRDGKSKVQREMRTLFKLSHKLIILFLTIIVFNIESCAPKQVREERFLMGTMVEIVAYGRNQEKVKKAVQDGFKEIERLEKKLTRYRADSVIGQINQNADKKPVKIDDEVFYLIEKSIEICKLSQGAFDITVLPLILLWNFDGENPHPPEAQTVKEKLNLVGCDKIVLDKENQTVFFTESGVMIDLGGIAKGYGAEKVAEILKKSEAEMGIVNLGGDLRVFGGGGKGIAIGIQDPRDRSGVVAKIYLRDSAVATSGDYERFFIYQGVRYSHIIDPRTGFPASSQGSVSVLYSDGMEADAWATALFVLGAERGMEVLKKLKGLEAVFIDENYSYRFTSGLQGKLIWLKEENRDVRDRDH